jgi:hypothetical protein
MGLKRCVLGPLPWSNMAFGAGGIPGHSVFKVSPPGHELRDIGEPEPSAISREGPQPPSWDSRRWCIARLAKEQAVR